MADGASRFYAGSWRTPAGIDRHRASKRRQVRMRAGEEILYLGSAPTVEDADRLRQKIRQEAPSGNTE